jgi:hypothetical protein
MRRALASVGIAVVTALAATACGAFADGTAGSVGDREVSVEHTDALTVDAVVVDGTGQAEAEDMESVLPGGDARKALLQLMLSAAVAEVVDELGLEVDTQAAEEQIKAQGGSLDQYDEHTRETVLMQLGGLSALNEWYSGIDLDDEADARKLYGLAPGLWDRRCVISATSTEVDEDEVSEMVEAGVGLEEVVREVTELESTTDSGACVSFATLLGTYTAGNDPAPIEAMVGAEPGEVVGPVTVGETKAWFEVTEVQEGDVDSMVQELSDSDGQFDPTLLPVWLLLNDSKVNSRYGTEVQLREGLSISRPQAPPAPEPVIEIDPSATPAPAP